MSRRTYSQRMKWRQGACPRTLPGRPHGKGRWHGRKQARNRTQPPWSGQDAASRLKGSGRRRSCRAWPEQRKAGQGRRFK